MGYLLEILTVKLNEHSDWPARFTFWNGNTRIPCKASGAARADAPNMGEINSEVFFSNSS
jgi:hypothetical protein